MSRSLVEKYELVLNQDPTSTVFVELAKALIERGDHPKAIEVCQQGLAHHPTSVVGRVLWGKALINLGKPAEAMNQFDLAVNIDRENPRAYNLIGEVLLHKALYRSALPILRKAAALQPNDGRVRQWLEQTRAALAGGPAPVLVDSTSVDLQPLSEEESEGTALLGLPPAATGFEDGAEPTVVMQAYTPEGQAPSPAAPDLDAPQTQVVPGMRGAPAAPARASAPRSSAPRAQATAEPAARPSAPVAQPSRDTRTVEIPEQRASVAPAIAPLQPGEGPVLTGIIVSEEEPPDPFAGVPKRTDSSDTLRGLTSTFDALSADGVDPFSGLGPPAGKLAVSAPLGGEASAQVPRVAEPSVVPEPALLQEEGPKAPPPTAGLLADVASAQNEIPTSELQLPTPGSAAPRGAPPAAPPGRRGLLDDIPDAIEPPSVVDAAPVEPRAQQPEAIAREYERELRARLEERAKQKTFLQAHGLKVAAAAVLLVIAVGGFGSYRYTRSKNSGKDLAGALSEGRAALGADTQERFAAAVALFNQALSMDSGSTEASARLGYAHALLYAEAGHNPDDKQKAQAALARTGVRDGFPELVVVAEALLADDASAASRKQALLGSPLDAPEVQAEAGRVLLADKKTDEGLKRLQRAVDLSPGNVRALVALGQYYLEEDDAEKALEFFNGSAAKVSPLHPVRVLGTAEARMMLGRELPESLNDVERLPSGAQISAQLQPRYQLVLGRLLSVNGRHEEAIKVLLTGQEASKATLGLDYGLALGGAYKLAGQMANAQATYEATLKLAPKNEEAREGLGRLLLMRSREKELLTRLPADAEARKVSMVRGIAYARLADWKRARQELARTQINNKFPAEAATWLAVADAAEGDAEKQKAVTALLRDKLLPSAKRNRPAVLIALGKLYMQQNELAKAKEVLEEAAREPTDYEGNALLGDLLLSSGLPDVALEPLQRAVERNPSHSPSRHLLVRVLAAAGRMGDAWKLAQAGVADNPASDLAQEDLAFAGLHDGHFKEAEAAIARAVKADSTNPERSRLQAQVLFARGQPKEAFPALERANKLNAKDPVTFCEIGNAFVRQGNTDTALRAYEAARREEAKVPCGLIGPFHARPTGGKAAVKELTELAKGSGNAWDRALAWASLARVQLSSGQLKDARAAAEEGLKESPFSAPALHALALVALRQKDEAKAIEALTRAIEADGAWGQLHLLLADQLWRTGAEGLPRAIAEYEAFLQLGGSEGDVARVRKALPQLKKRLN